MDRNSILIVDDDPEVRKTLSDILKLKGYVPATAATGKEALDRVKKEAPAVAVIDLKMEDISGLEVMKQIKKSSPGTECIILTGYASRESAIEAVNLGAYGYLEKPYDMEQLLLIIRRAIEKQETEQALRESEGKYRVLFESKLDGMFVLDAETMTVVLANQTAAEIYGFSSVEEVIGVNPLDFVAPEGKERTLKIMVEDMFEKDMQEINEFRTITKDGKEKWISAVGASIEYEGKLAGLVSFRDITERKRAEEALKESEQKYRFLVENLDEIILVLSKKGKILFANKKAVDTSGYPKEQLVGQSILKFLTKDSVAKAFYSLVQEFLGRPQPMLQVKIKTRSGEIRDFEIAQGSAPVYEKGKQIGILINGSDITERKRAEEALRESERHFRALIENSSDIIQIVDSEGIIRYLSPSVQRILGYKPEELIGRPSIDVVHPDDLPLVAKAFGEALQKPRVPVITACRCKHKDGTWRVIEGTGINQLDNPNVNGFISNMHDITERKQADEELRSSEERLKILFEFAPDACYLNDLKGNFVDGNKAAEEITGYKRAELIGKNFLKLKLLSVKQTPKAAMLLAKNALGQPTGPDEFTLNRKDGSQVQTEVRTFPVRIKEQTLVLGIARDITERKKMEETLRVEKERIEEYLNIAGVMLGAVDADENITLMNKKGYEILGYKEGELTGRNWFDLLVPQRMRAEIRGVFCSLMAGDIEPVEHYENPLLTKDGEERLIAFHNTVIKNANGQIVGALLSGEDITERKRAEEALKESEERYKSLVNNVKLGVFRNTPGPTGKFIEVNPAMEEITGYSRDELLRMDVSDLYQRPQERRAFAEEIAALVGKTIRKELNFRKKDGTKIVVSDTTIAVRDNAGQVQYFDGIIEDITEQKRAERELAESEEHYRALVDGGADMGEAIVLLQDTDKMEAAHLFANDEWTRMTGYTPEELREISYFDLIHPRDRDAVAGRVRRRFEGEHLPGRWEICIIDKDGREVPVEAAATPITYQDRPAVVGYVRDISERKKAKEEIERQRKYFEALFDGSAEAVASLDVQNRLVDINPTFEKMFGHKLEDVKGKDIDDYILPRSRKEEGKSFSRRAWEGEVVVAESIRKRADGREIPVSIITAPIILDGKQIGTFAIYRDITERKKSEEQLEHSFVNLAETVSRAMASRDPYTADHQRRVAELARLVGEKMGLDKDRLRGLYIGGLLHDIGKISIPGDILSKPGELTDEEWNLIRAHAKQGYQILKDTDLPWPVAEMALHHHERLDGSGYPHGISGDKLSLENRILGVCDVVEAMSSYRPYRPARSKEEVLEEIKSGRGTKYDASVVDIVVQMIESGKLELFSQT